ncbi:Extradiol ring-cleavage dioxygenase class III enzyme subunit B [Peniophora sp. CONT]|nr:Extradiol ring-cleavage dioxygenase class III enzyme subunit B [Peniophora sp. CONT]
MSSSALPTSRSEWKAAIDALPNTPERIPSIFIAHGSPMLAMNAASAPHMPASVVNYMGSEGPLATFLADLGPALLEKYKPKGIVVFSAHWETNGERLVTEYGDSNPLMMDYFGFDKKMYEIKFESRGDKALSGRVVELFKEAGMLARTTSATEPRGRDGRGFEGPGFDHGVFFPFRIMFSESFKSIPIVQASIDGSLTPEGNLAVGRAVAKLREEGILILSGGLTVHNLRDLASFHPDTANSKARAFNDAVTQALPIQDPKEREKALVALVKHTGFRAAHPREDHFVPLYVAAGAGEDGGARVLSALYGTHSVAFGV